MTPSCNGLRNGQLGVIPFCFCDEIVGVCDKKEFEYYDFMSGHCSP